MKMKHAFLLTLIVACGALSGPAAAEDGFFDSNGVKIRYVTEGQGETIVLIHGWMGDSSMWGRDAAGHTKLTPPDGYRVIALDCRGHGQSDKPHDTAQYGSEMAADVVRLLDHLKIEKTHLIGYSMGAFIAGKVAATNPQRVLSVIYGGQAPLLTGESGSREIDAFAEAVDKGQGLGSYIIEITPPGRPKPTPEQADAIAKFLYVGQDLKAYAAAGRSFNGLEVKAEDLKKSTAPALFIYGSKESENLKTRVAALRELLGRSQEKVIEGTDHMTTPANPEFASTIIGFMRSVKANAKLM
jgi:pimeloyl-ACP methyl ester carboxylesterase